MIINGFLHDSIKDINARGEKKLFKLDQSFPKTWDTNGSIISLHKKMDIDQ